ncbi:beta-lactamase family protein [Gammaproteobacteria bacterium]|nr:beta-lactamase family protein [Gammaproteobacteria bacterium]|tara:strand:- start:3348 stop:4475 length:1128 start_codon:yes stop_codon:yes gene_type:complete
MRKLSLLLILATLASCGGSDSSSLAVDAVAPSEPSNLPDTSTYPGVSWETYEPADVNMSEAELKQALDYAFKSTRNTQGVVIVRHGVIVAERYANGESENSLATSWSTGKSFASALIGIAIDQGYIDSIDVPAENYLAPWVNTDKQEISVRAILEMRSGLAEAIDGDANIYTSGGDTGDQLAYALNRTPETTPRTDNWAYQNTDSMLLAGILETATGQNVLDYADMHLFSKIGMNAEWWTDELGHAMTYCCIDTTSRDFARFGLLYARDGRWLDDQIVSQAWVTESTTVPEGTNNPYYGLQWWVEPSYGYFYSAGLHQNNIYVYPQYDLVIVRNSTYTKEGADAIRSENNYHSTLPPLDWSDAEFLTPIIESLTN